MKLQCVLPGNVITTGPITDKLYQFLVENNRIVDVDDADAALMLEMTKQQRPCCNGNPQDIKIFISV